MFGTSDRLQKLPCLFRKQPEIKSSEIEPVVTEGCKQIAEYYKQKQKPLPTGRFFSRLSKTACKARISCYNKTEGVKNGRSSQNTFYGEGGTYAPETVHGG